MTAVDVLVDTNVLLRSAQTGHPQCRIARAAVAHCRSLGHRLVLVPQVVYEFWVVCTRPEEQNGLGLDGMEAMERLEGLFAFFRLLRDERLVFDCWLNLIKAQAPLGKVAHDVRLIAAMERHRVPQILTFNTRHFARYPSVVALSPDQLLSADETSPG